MKTVWPQRVRAALDGHLAVVTIMAIQSLAGGAEPLPTTPEPGLQWRTGREAGRVWEELGAQTEGETVTEPKPKAPAPWSGWGPRAQGCLRRNPRLGTQGHPTDGAPRVV